MSSTAVPRTWEYKEVALPRGTSRESARQYLTRAAETEHWRLARVHLPHDGSRRVWLRRKVYRVPRTA